jgi:hypothetical protein
MATTNFAKFLLAGNLGYYYAEFRSPAFAFNQ